MIVPNKITKTNRKSLTLTVNDRGELIVKCPKNMSLDRVFNFIKEKEKWIEKKQTSTKKILEQNYKIFNMEQVFFLGKLYNVVEIKGITSPYLSTDFLGVPKTLTERKKQNLIKDWFLLNTENIIVSRLKYLAKSSKIESFSQINIINSKAKWGMCDVNKAIYLNWKLLMLPPELIDYVCIHELCHILQMNHSKLFWDNVAKILPKYKQNRELLKQTNFLIKLF